MFFLILILILLINLWLFMPFFGLGLFGDDWLAIFRYSYYLDEPKHLGPYSTEYFNHFKYFLNAYGSQDILMAFLYKTFGADSSIYFIISYILRIGAGFSIYFPAFFLTRSKVAAWFAVFFFLFSSIGLEASNWVFNMPSYLAITFFSFLLYFYLKYHQDDKIKNLFLSYLFFALTFASSPIRAHGLIPFIIFTEILLLVLERKWRFFKFSLMKISGFFIVYLAIYFLGFKETISGNPTHGLIGGLKNSFQLLSQNRFEFFFYPLATLGGMIIPNSISFWVGAAVVVITLIIFLYQKSNSLLKYGLLIGLGWAVISSLYPWLQPNTSAIFATTHRYLIVSGVGISLMLATIIALSRNTKAFFISMIIGSILLIMHASTTRKALNVQYQTHSRETVRKIWSAIPYIPEVGKSIEPLVFYFEGDGTNETIIRDSITFGFPPHIAIIYNLSENELMPIPMSDWKEVESAVSDGKSLTPHGRLQKPVSPDRIYAFKLQGKDNLINITEIVREKLKELK